MESKEIVVAGNASEQKEKAAEKNWTPEQIKTIRNTVAVGADESELNMFLSIAETYSLDPLLRELWFVKTGSRGTIMTGRDGYLKIANRNPNYDGITGDVIHAGDKFIKDGDNVKLSYGTNNRGPIVGAYAIVYRKDRTHPVYVFAPFNEYNKNNSVWRQYPSAMILKVAESMALKRAFSISGLVTEEEMGGVQQQIQRQEPEERQQVQKDDSAERKIQLSQLWQRYLAACDNQAEDAKDAMKKVTGKASSNNFTSEDIRLLFEDIVRREDEKMNAEVNNEQQEQEETAPKKAANSENATNSTNLTNSANSENAGEGGTMEQPVNHCGTFLGYEGERLL